MNLVTRYPHFPKLPNNSRLTDIRGW